MLRYLIVDGMFHGTGLRDAVEGGFIEPNLLGLPTEFVLQLESWLKKYENEHVNGFRDLEAVRRLDESGLKIASILVNLLPESQITYFSAATMEKTLLNR